jgi:hypothetical protein
MPHFITCMPDLISEPCAACLSMGQRCSALNNSALRHFCCLLIMARHNKAFAASRPSCCQNHSAIPWLGLFRKLCIFTSGQRKGRTVMPHFTYWHAVSDRRALRCMPMHRPAMQRVEQFCFAALLLLIDYCEA